MKPEQLQAIRERCEKATPGPWYASHERRGEYVDSVGDVIAKCISDQCIDDTEFIAHAREDVPALLDYADSLIKENERLRGALEWYADIKNYLRQDDGHGGVHYPIDSDKGGRARQALEEK